MKIFIFLAIGMFSVGCNTFLIAGILPQIGHSIAQPIAVTGQGITMFSLTYLVTAPLFAMIFVNRRIKPMIQIALSVFILGNLITLQSDNIMYFLLGRALSGVGAGFFTPLCISMAVRFSNKSTSGRALSVVWGANSAGVVFGIPLGLYLASVFNWQSSILYIISISLVALMGFTFQNFDTRLESSSPFGDLRKRFFDKKTLSVIAISCLTALASLGLFSYIASIQSGSPNSLRMTLFSWGLGGFIGSSLVGTFIDRIRKPEEIMAFVLLGLILTFISIPFTTYVPYVGLIPFFMWGVFGWAATNPQQQILFKHHENQGIMLAAMNSSVFGLGGVIGTMLGGLIITSGFNAINLAYPAACVLAAVFIYQLRVIKNPHKESHP